mmetsp:Transcript_24896/g.98354  ORF Transcript_24896/g.98354 Transcript_24896/m.98354 type:complete len:210 (+) Transcript_24896:1267-1896(+)
MSVSCHPLRKHFALFFHNFTLPVCCDYFSIPTNSDECRNAVDFEPLQQFVGPLCIERHSVPIRLLLLKVLSHLLLVRIRAHKYNLHRQLDPSHLIQIQVPQQRCQNLTRRTPFSREIQNNHLIIKNLLSIHTAPIRSLQLAPNNILPPLHPFPIIENFYQSTPQKQKLTRPPSTSHTDGDLPRATFQIPSSPCSNKSSTYRPPLQAPTL